MQTVVFVLEYATAATSDQVTEENCGTVTAMYEQGSAEVICTVPTRRCEKIESDKI